MRKAESAGGETWDSSALHGVLQRFPREKYCKLARKTLAGIREKKLESRTKERRLTEVYRKVTRRLFSFAIWEAVGGGLQIKSVISLTPPFVPIMRRPSATTTRQVYDTLFRRSILHLSRDIPPA